MKLATSLCTFVCFSISISVVCVQTLPLRGEDPTAGVEFFERHVRPLLAEKCFSCHGRGQTKGALALDSRKSVMKGGDSGAAVVEGKPDESLMIAAVEYSGALQMPPDAQLSRREIDILKQWVSLGIPWPATAETAASPMRSPGTISDQDRQFWSFRPIDQPPIPSVKQVNWPRQPLDHFVLNRLEAEGLEPVAEADRRTYIRRATFDLIGLPPAEADINAFENDTASDAYEKLIDRLLDAPQYGERWSRHWLDVARYGEDQAHTFQARRYPSGYRYRDWVIHSFNRDLPIDQFLMQQIAGDLLPGEDRQERLAALGFFALGPVYYADAGCAPKAKADEYDDRIDTLTRGILGLTVSCARCHDHKFDPISMVDYYALSGVFSSTEYVEEPLAPPEVVKAYNDGQAAIKLAEQQLKDGETEAARKAGESLAPQTADYLLTAWRVQQRRLDMPNYQVKMAVEGTQLHELVVERWLQAITSDALKNIPAFAPWFELNSNATTEDAVQRVANEIQSKLINAIQTRREAEATLRLEANQAQTNQLASSAKDANTKDAKQLEKALKSLLSEEIVQLLNSLVDNANAPLAIPKDRVEKFLTAESKQTVAALKKAIEDQKKAAPAKYEVVHTLTEGKPANQKIQLRGNVNDLGEEAPRRFLEVLAGPDSQPFKEGSGRLELAKAIASADNPLTARVFVNRVWQHHFGRGIVSTPSNFGLLGVPPSHPELLDYLAARFIASGWSLKQLHRDIMLSATYRLASTSIAANQERDPENRLLWRMNRRRLDIESWRDSLLLVSGNLDSSIGGSSVNLADKNNRRRTLYASISRHELNPVLRLFDFPDPNLTSERRSLTTVPMQQLFVLNSDFVVDQSRAIAARAEKSAPDDHEKQISQLYSWLFGRRPADHELGVGINFLKLESPADVSQGDVKLSRLEQYAQALLSTNEFFFVD